MKNYLLAILISFQCYSQGDCFFDNIKTVCLPITIDQISYNNLNQYMNVDYDKLKSHLINKELGIQIEENKKNTKFFICGKFKIIDKTAIIIIIDRPFNKSIDAWLLIYSKNLDLINFIYVGSKSSYGDDNQKFSYSVINYNHFKRYDDLKNEITYCKILNGDKDFRFETADCEESVECINYKPKFDSIPQRNFNSYNFNKIFFEKNIHLLPFKDCSPLNYSKMIVDIGGYSPTSFKNYFIDSKKLQNGKTIIFFLNVYEFEKWKAVKEIGYLLFDSDYKLSKIDVIASYRINEKVTKIVSSSKVFLSNDHIQIESFSEDKLKKKYKID